MVGELTQVEAVKESKLKCILQDLIGRFCEHHTKWRNLVSAVAGMCCFAKCSSHLCLYSKTSTLCSYQILWCMSICHASLEDKYDWNICCLCAELDVLISLVISSDYYEGPTCRPIISTGFNYNEVPHLEAKSLGHPIIKSDSLGRGTFVPNDINVGGADHATFILLTGPNMGGKSTLLRQICLAVILAQVKLYICKYTGLLFCFNCFPYHSCLSQVGADVPAEHFELSLVDRIFVRMGAKDHIMAGQSTFLTELSETASMLVRCSGFSFMLLFNPRQILECPMISVSCCFMSFLWGYMLMHWVVNFPCLMFFLWGDHVYSY